MAVPSKFEDAESELIAGQTQIDNLGSNPFSKIVQNVATSEGLKVEMTQHPKPADFEDAPNEEEVFSEEMHSDSDIDEVKAKP